MLIEKEEIIKLDDEQRAAISSYHKELISELSDSFNIDSGKREKQLSLGMQIASFLGALGLAASLFFLFYRFWGQFPTGLQVSILITTPIAGILLTMAINQRFTDGYFAKLSGMVTLSCFVLNLLMLGRIFNINPSENAFLVWAIFAFILAYASDARLLLAAGIISFTCFLSARTGTWFGCYWIHFGERPENFFIPALILFAIPLLFKHRQYSGFQTIYRVFAMLIFFLPVLILSNWGYISYLYLDSSTIEIIYQLTGFVVSALAIWAGIKKDWPDLVNTGNVFFVIFLYTKFFDWWWELMPKYLFFLIIGLSSILFLLIFKRIRNKPLEQAEGAFFYN